MHRDFEGLIAKGKVAKLAEVLHNELEEIDCVFSEFRLETDKRALKAIVAARSDK